MGKKSKSKQKSAKGAASSVPSTYSSSPFAAADLAAHISAHTNGGAGTGNTKAGTRSDRERCIREHHHSVNIGPVLFGIGGTSRPSIVPGRPAILRNLKSRPELNGNGCTVKEILPNGRIIIVDFQNHTTTLEDLIDSKQRSFIRSDGTKTKEHSSVLSTKLNSKCGSVSSDGSAKANTSTKQGGSVLPSSDDSKKHAYTVSSDGTKNNAKESISVLPTKLEMRWERNEKIGEEDDVCPICCHTVMVMNVNASIYSCCGGITCNKCYANILLAGPIANPDLCPLCRADTSDGSDEAQLHNVRKRAERGNANACYNLGGYYDYGTSGLPQDQAQARYWYRQGALNGEIRAAQNLGCCYRDGEGGPVDLIEAATYFKMAAESGYSPGACNFGLALLRGHGVAQDLEAAEKWLQRASEKGHQLASQELSTLRMYRPYFMTK